MSKGLFSRKFTSYKVSTSPLNVEVERRFSDFKWLHDALVREFPGTYIPPMANKSGTTQNKFDPSLITGRLETMQEFISAVVDSPLFVSSYSVLSFITDSDANFAKHKKDADKLAVSNPNTALIYGINKKTFSGKQSIKLENFWTSDGQISSVISPQLKIFSSSFKDALKDLIPLFGKCRENSLHLIDSVIAAGSASDKLADNLKEVSIVIKKFNDSLNTEGLEKWSSLEQIYSNLGETFKKNSQAFAKMSVSLTDSLSRAMKYSKKEAQGLEELLKKRDEASSFMFRSYFDLELKKDKLFKPTETSKIHFDLDAAKLPKEELLQHKPIAKMFMFKEV